MRLSKYKKEIRFFLLFILFFLLLQVAHYLTRPYTTPLLVDRLSAGVSGPLINLFTPEENVTVHGKIMGSGSFRLNVAAGCEGIEGVILITAAICAFYMTIKHKLLGIVVGTLIIYAANLARIVVLYYTLKYKPALFDVMHIFVGQTFIIIVGLLFFMFWISRFARLEKNPV